MTLGQLYEVDMRLRPSGESGMLFATFDGFRSYQQEDAWTWEHQALVRARFVAGDPAVAEKVNAVRQETLCRQRDRAELAQEVVKMRRRMRDHLLPKESEDVFHLKQGSGGIVDIEFMVQFAVLAFSFEHPALANWSDNVRILETLAETGQLTVQESEELKSAYLEYRSAAHELALQQQPGEVAASVFRTQRDTVRTKWQELFADAQLEDDREAAGP
jgi:glutamate-ammonia-ligase adenylyltransferase